MSLNPQDKTGDGGVRRVVTVFTGTVVSTPSSSGPDGRNHAVEVSPKHTGQSFPAIVTESVGGDVSIPTEGTDVLCTLQRNGTIHVVGTTYSAEESVPKLETGERRIGHPLTDSHVELRADGSIYVENDGGTTIEITSDGDIVLDGGSTRPVTDVSTTTDADGDITSIDLTRSSNVYVPK